MAKSNGNGWNWSESLAERMRMQKTAMPYAGMC